MSDQSTIDQRSGLGRRSTDFQTSQFPQQPADGWHLDKKVPLSLIFAMLMQAAMVIWAIADIKKDVELLKQDSVGLHARDTLQADSLKEAMRQMQDQFSRLDAKLDRLIERGAK